jgi:hypothetical protein
MALRALQGMGEAMDDSCLERLFWRDNQMILRHLASNHAEMLQWHFMRHKDAMKYCISALGGRLGRSDAHDSDFPTDLEIYTSEDDYFSEDEPELGQRGGIDYPSNYPITALSEFINNTAQRRGRSA